MKDEIAILLSTYNGEKYLNEQIDSILAQSYQNWTLFVRDDGSTDRTVSIIDEYCRIYPKKIKKICNTKGNAGVIRSFEILLENSIADYSMFCDQDDVWLPKKIEKTLDRMKTLEITNGCSTPILVHTDLTVVDENLNLIYQSFCKFSRINASAINSSIYYLGLINSVTGCTLMINRAARNKVLPFANNIEMHDAWIAICVKKNSGVLSFIEEQTILYRQHSNNVLGAISGKFILKEKILNFRKIINNNVTHYTTVFKPMVCDSVIVYLFYKLKYIFQVRL